MTYNSDESEYNSNVKINVLNNNTNMFSLHVTPTLTAFLVTNHAFIHIVKEAKTTSILTRHKWSIELIRK